MQNCTKCFGKRWFAKIDKRTGLQVVHADGRRVWRCYRCNHTQEEESVVIFPKIYRPKASILYIDIEVSKSLYFNYGAKVPSKYLRADDLLHEYYIICWSASYVGNDKVWSECISSKSARQWTDAKVLQKLRDLINAADIIAGHNIDAFDMKKANTRFLLNGINPVIGKKTIDTLKVARSKFNFESNKLDFISQRLGFRPKDDITNDDWLKIVKTGDKETLDKVNTYCKGDVENGKAVLERLMQWSGKKDDYGSTTLETVYQVPLRKTAQ